MIKKDKLLIVDICPTTLMYKLIFFLKDFFEIKYLILQKEDYNLLDYKNLGVKIDYFDVNKSKKEKIKFFLRLIIERFKGYKFILGNNESNWLTYFLFNIFDSSKKIYYIQDLFLFLLKNQRLRPRIGRVFEKSNLKKADFIIHRGPENQFELVRKDEIKRIKGKKIQFFSCFDRWIIPLNNKDKTKDISLVFVGVCPDYQPALRIPLNNMFEEIAKLGLNVHVYPLYAGGGNKFKKKENKNIIYHDQIPSSLLSKEISKYHYGIASAFYDKNFTDERFIQTGIGNKFLSYLEAGIPIIINEEQKYGAELIKKYNCGVVFKEKEINHLKEILKKQEYTKLLKGVERARKDLLASKNVKKIAQELNKSNINVNLNSRSKYIK